eukprot:350077-Chlamydomonas_euryale.AAC.21
MPTRAPASLPRSSGMYFRRHAGAPAVLTASASSGVCGEAVIGGRCGRRSVAGVWAAVCAEV